MHGCISRTTTNFQIAVQDKPNCALSKCMNVYIKRGVCVLSETRGPFRVRHPMKLDVVRLHTIAIFSILSVLSSLHSSKSVEFVA